MKFFEVLCYIVVIIVIYHYNLCCVYAKVRAHPFVLSVENGNLYIVMDYCEAGTVLT